MRAQPKGSDVGGAFFVQTENDNVSQNCHNKQNEECSNKKEGAAEDFVTISWIQIPSWE